MDIEEQVVFKCSFHCYSGMVRLTDQEATAITQVVCYSSQGEKAGHTMWGHTMWGHMGKYQGWSGGRESKGEV